jgi:hypothetical protein
MIQAADAINPWLHETTPQPWPTSSRMLPPGLVLAGLGLGESCSGPDCVLLAQLADVGTAAYLGFPPVQASVPAEQAIALPVILEMAASDVELPT